MRSFTFRTLTVLFSLALSAALATSAGAYALSITTTYTPGVELVQSDTITVDVFLDADVGLTLLTVPVVYDDDTELTYNGAASAALTPNPLCLSDTVCGAGASGAQPTYILYTMGAKGTPATILYPQQMPFWLNWPGTLTRPNTQQVNINFAEPSFREAANSGNGVYIGTLVFDVGAQVDGSAVIDLCPECEAAIIQSGNNPPVPVSAIPLTGNPITVTVPEPAFLSLALAGFATVYIVRRRRA